ncbi:helix-turn-helix domain-containing protein [Streptomyces sp. 840.1]|uniref:helix-turn-helix domain-containing protein n=1 Tax=Streptomyces sp. 840.1 TaxID=2485152 RepID=UPI0021A8DB5A|nr:helix-turn-helix domain-containing protein [Streptomyces sp. 840.1]
MAAVRITAPMEEEMPQKPKLLDDTESARAWWGKELRNWRNVRSLSSKGLGKRVHLSGTMIERIEKNERLCDAGLARRLDDALEAGGALRRLWRLVEEEAAGRSDDADSSVPVHRPAGRAGQADWVLDGYPPGLIDPGRGESPSVVRPEDIAQVLAAASVIAEWDNLYGGGGIVRSSLYGQLLWARGLLAADYPSALEADLFAAVGRLSVVLGASAFDAHEHEDATRLLRFGRWCAERADDWHLRAAALNWLARQSIWCGMPDEGLTHAEDGLVRADRLTPREQAMLHNARARAWAKMRRPGQALAAISRSDEVFGPARENEDVVWMSFYDDAQHHGDTGHAAFDLALLSGQSPAEATARLTKAMDGYTDAYVRSRALCGTKLATLIMATGDPGEALTVAHRALDELGRLRSNRAVEDVMDLSKECRRHADDAEVVALRERIAAAVRS